MNKKPSETKADEKVEKIETLTPEELASIGGAEGQGSKFDVNLEQLGNNSQVFSFGEARYT